MKKYLNITNGIIVDEEEHKELIFREATRLYEGYLNYYNELGFEDKEQFLFENKGKLKTLDDFVKICFKSNVNFRELV